MADDVVLNKAALVERSIARVHEVHAGDDARLRPDTITLESILLNLQRACEAAIDLAMHLVRVRRLGVPQDSRDAFDLLVRGGVLDPDLADRLRRMVGFRTVVVHAYEEIDLDIVRAILRERLPDLLAFTGLALRLGRLGRVQSFALRRPRRSSDTSAAGASSGARGEDRSRTVIFLTTTRRVSPAALGDELAAFGVEADDWLQLDGGGSTRTILDAHTTIQPDFLTARSWVPHVIGAYSR